MSRDERGRARGQGRIDLDLIDPTVSCEDGPDGRAGCSACCLHVGTPPAFFAAYAAPAWDGKLFAGHEDYQIWLAMPEELRQELRDYYDAVWEGERLDAAELGLPCIWLDPNGRRCLHYEHRPWICRDFAVGGDDCAHFRARFLEERKTKEKLR